MKAELQIFKNPEFGEVRIVEIDNETYFSGNDVARILGYSNPRDAIVRHCKSWGVVKHDTPINGVIQSLTYIDESNVYRLVIKSALPAAEAFETWIFKEVLPSIRSRGMYATTETVEKLLEDPGMAIKLFEAIRDERERRAEAESRAALAESREALKDSMLDELNNRNEEMKPKALFADAVSTSTSSILVAELSKILSQNGVEIGQNRLFRYLCDKGYLCSRPGEYYNQPTQRAMEMKLFEIKRTAITKPNGSVLVSSTPKVTGKGQVYFVNEFTNEIERQKQLIEES